MAKIRGEFHAERLGEQAEARFGISRRQTLWPADYFVRFGPPVELIGPDGIVIAQEGDVLFWAGGIGDAVVWLRENRTICAVALSIQRPYRHREWDVADELRLDGLRRR